jgi:hypothetical protein
MASVTCTAPRRAPPTTKLSRETAQPADGGGRITFPLSSAPMAISSYFCCLRLRQPLPGEIGGGINGGSMGNPD